MGYLDEDGFLFLADRKEDMIISGGFNIWPAELENALASHPAVAEVAVVGVPHDKWGETPKAVVVLREGTSADEDELIEWTREKLGAVKRVTSVDFADELPKSAVGKVLRREVRAATGRRGTQRRRSMIEARRARLATAGRRTTRRRRRARPSSWCTASAATGRTGSRTSRRSRRTPRVAVDLPGFGRSSGYAGEVTMARYADTLVELLDELAIPAATLVGNSMGGC